MPFVPPAKSLAPPLAPEESSGPLLHDVAQHAANSVLAKILRGDFLARLISSSPCTGSTAEAGRGPLPNARKAVP
jgi:hypothetical protein